MEFVDQNIIRMTLIQQKSEEIEDVKDESKTIDVIKVTVNHKDKNGNSTKDEKDGSSKPLRLTKILDSGGTEELDDVANGVKNIDLE